MSTPHDSVSCAQRLQAYKLVLPGKRAITQQFTHGSFRQAQQHDFVAVGLPYQRPIMSYSQDMLGCLDDKLTTLP